MAAYSGAHPDAGNAAGVKLLIAWVLLASQLFQNAPDTFPRRIRIVLRIN